MRKQKTIKIDTMEITIKELRVKDIRDIIAQTDEILSGGLDQIEKVLPLTTNLTLSEIEDMSPSELQIIWDTFKEINAVFFGMVAKTGLAEALKDSILKDLTALFAASLNPATESPGNTDTPSS